MASTTAMKETSKGYGNVTSIVGIHRRSCSRLAGVP
jgi:hypothetical protein